MQYKIGKKPKYSPGPKLKDMRRKRRHSERVPYLQRKEDYAQGESE